MIVCDIAGHCCGETSTMDQRLLLFAIISEIEADLRNSLRAQTSSMSLEKTIGRADLDKALSRATRDGFPISGELAAELLDYLELGDIIKVLARSEQRQSKSSQAVLKSASALVQCRNRVMHRRPLEFDDVPLLTSLAKNLAKDKALWPGLYRLINQLSKDPGHLGRYAGSVVYEDHSRAFHNLPLADFDDTGFVGREDQIRQLEAALCGPFPVITVLGLGGLGKTALAVRALYSLLDDPSSPFEAIVWTTAKTTRLTRSDIQEVQGAIKSSFGIASAVLETFGESDQRDPFSRVLDMMREFRILLAIDNLETILDENIRSFVRRIPSGSKVLFTSRVSLGAMDLPIEVPPLKVNEAAQFFRRACGVYNAHDASQLPNETVNGYCRQLSHSPLAIKWFAQALRAGASAQRLLADPKLVLRFCLENVIDKLSPNARLTLDALCVARKRLGAAALHFVTNLDLIETNGALLELIACNLVTVHCGKLGEDDLYQLTQMASLYVKNYFAADPETQRRLQGRLQALVQNLEEQQATSGNQNIFDLSYVRVRRDQAESDAIAAMYLRYALRHVRDQNYAAAHDSVERARQAAPTFFEVYRVDALLLAAVNNTVGAAEAYEQAVALEPKYAPLRFFFAGFLMRHARDTAGALEQLKIVHNLDPSAIAPRIELARAYLYLHRYTEAREAIAGVSELGANTQRQARILVDLRLQAHVRAADKALRQADMESARGEFVALSAYLQEIDYQLLDERSASQLHRGLELALPVSRSEQGTAVGVAARQAANIIQAKLQHFGIARPHSAAHLDTNAASRARAVSEIRSGATPNVHRGTIRWATDSGDYGFISDDNGQDHFVHRRHFVQPLGSQRIQVGQRVCFEIGLNAKGPCAVRVNLLEDEPYS